MSEVVTVKLQGLDQLQKVLSKLPHNLRRRALREVLVDAAKPVRDLAKQYRRDATGWSSAARTGKFRTHRGTVERAIKIRTSRQATRAGDVGVFVNVKPSKPGGRNDPNDPFYWRFLEFGTRKMDAQPFLRPAAAALTESLHVFEREIIPRIEKLNTDPNGEL